LRQKEYDLEKLNSEKNQLREEFEHLKDLRNKLEIENTNHKDSIKNKDQELERLNRLLADVQKELSNNKEYLRQRDSELERV